MPDTAESYSNDRLCPLQSQTTLIYGLTAFSSIPLVAGKVTAMVQQLFSNFKLSQIHSIFAYYDLVPL